MYGKFENLNISYMDPMETQMNINTILDHVIPRVWEHIVIHIGTFVQHLQQDDDIKHFWTASAQPLPTWRITTLSN